jgi:hypothetical protein
MEIVEWKYIMEITKCKLQSGNAQWKLHSGNA